MLWDIHVGVIIGCSTLIFRVPQYWTDLLQNLQHQMETFVNGFLSRQTIFFYSGKKFYKVYTLFSSIKLCKVVSHFWANLYLKK